MKKIMKISLLAILTLLLCFSAVACTSVPTGKAAYDTSETGKGESVKMTYVKEEIDSMKVEDFEPSSQRSDYVLIKVKDYGDIVVVLRRDIAPNTVENFKKLVAEGFYTGTVFHRVVENFMIQGGGYVPFDGKLEHKDSAAIKGEFTSNGFLNNLTHVRGVISMARTTEPNSATSQFFIMHQTTTSLNNQYASFGYVLAGMDVVDAIATCEVDNPGSTSPQPLKDVIIESITFVQPK